MSDILAIIVTIIFGFLGDAILGVSLNWPDAGAIFAVAAMGWFILRKIKK